MVAAYAPETRVDLSTLRDGQMIVVKVVLGSGRCPTEQHTGCYICRAISRSALANKLSSCFL